MPETSLTCGCTVVTTRDFLGRVIGTITARHDACPRPDHVPGHVVLMPGREHAGQADGGVKPS